MTELPAESVAIVRASRERSGTCDNCSEGDVPLPWESGDAWVCQPCYDNEERAIQAVALSLEFHAGGPGWTSYEQVARIAVNAYNRAQFDGSPHA